jgi:5-methylcytosine-specific restriction endonuclease McrA
MPTMLIKSRQKAFQQQLGCCIYCYKPMWTEKPEGFAIKFKLTKRQVRFYQCTAEHLLPRQNGGKDSLNNIAAACKYCNQQRHKSKSPLPPEKYQQHVQKKVGQCKWPTANFLNHPRRGSRGFKVKTMRTPPW